ncbi:MAG: tRNA nucleotidyltransferase [Flavobacteriales bacterium]|nr:MAG: tRNA nucleotidyltransferase [Flavobacteriales bacterium]
MPINLAQDLKHPIFKIISEAAEKSDVRAFVIGGYVRDLLLNRPCKDIDIVVEGSGIEMAKKVAKADGKQRKVHVFKNFGTAMLTWDDYQIEFVGARKESYRKDSRKPIVENGTIEDDQLRRDFTINTLSLSLEKEKFGELFDPFGGMQDLNTKIIRTPLEPSQTYSDDPLRMMRAIRFASQLNFNVDKNSLEAISQNKERIRIVSQERITEELNKIILSPKPSGGFKLLFNTGLLDLIFPEMAQLQGVDLIDGKAHKDNFYHTLKVLDNISKNTENLWLRWAAILHDIAKPATKYFDKSHGWTFHGHEDKGARMVPKIFRNLRLPLDEKMRYVQKLVRLHLRPIALVKDEVTDSGLRRVLFESGDDLEDLMTLCEADITSKNEKKVQRYLKNFKTVRQKMKDVEARDHIRNFQPPVSGKLIMETFGIKPCREIGIIKTAIKEAILEGEIKNDTKTAFDYMLKKGKELGLKPVKKLKSNH